MMNKPTRAAGSLVSGAVAVSLLVPLAAHADISVQVNGRPVQFSTVQPARVDGRVLIPLRAVVESLGAEIRWEPSTQTVRGSKGQREFSLQIGSRGAMVNGNPSTLDVPAQLISGTTMVPLRFVAEALGAEVEWNAADQRVAINTPLDQEMPGANRVTGEVVAVRPNENPPTLTVNANGIRSTYQVRGDTIVLRGEEGARGMQVELNQLREGDRVQLRVNPDTGRAEVVEAFYPRGAEQPVARTITGEVAAVRTTGGVRTVTVRTEEGRQTFTIPERTPVLRATGTRPLADAALQDIAVGDQVRLNLDGQLVTRLEAVARGANLPAEGEVVGEVTAVRETAPTSITVRSGNDRVSYDITPQTVLLRKSGTGQSVRVNLRQIRPGDQVRLQLDPTGNVARVVDATAPAAVDPEPSRDIRIASLTHGARANQPLRAGSKLNVTLTGTPGGTATVDVGTIARNVPLQEDPQRPGRYTGSFTVPRDVTAKEVTLIGQIRKGNETSPLAQAPVVVNVDSQAPSITEFAPAARTTVTNRQPDIYAEISDAGGSGIDEQSLRMVVRGKDVTPEVKLTNRFLIYTPKTALPPGNVPVVVSLKDAAGNIQQVSWQFAIQPKAAVVQSVTHNAAKALRAGDVLEVMAKGQAKGRATFDVGNVVRGVAMKETAPGVYVGTYTVKRGDQLLKAPVAVEIVAPGGQRQQLAATAPVNLVTQDPKPATITSPVKPFALGNTLVVTGTAEPNTKVLVEVKYTGRAIGFLPVGGTLGQQEVTVGKNGRWQTEPFEARLPLGVRKPDLTITAVTVDAAGTQSEPAVVEVKTQ